MENIHLTYRKNNHRTRGCQVQQNDPTIESQRIFRTKNMAYFGLHGFWVHQGLMIVTEQLSRSQYIRQSGSAWSMSESRSKNRVTATNAHTRTICISLRISHTILRGSWTSWNWFLDPSTHRPFLLEYKSETPSPWILKYNNWLFTGIALGIWKSLSSLFLKMYF